MKNKNRFLPIRLILFLFLTGLTTIRAQEFNCNVTVSSLQVQGTDKNVFYTLQDELLRFINDRRWTDYSFRVEERIQCSIIINITERISTDVFRATINIVASRPVFNTSYTSTLFNYQDKDFDFEYVEHQPLEFIENTHTSNLTSVVAYYLYIILALDFDSFAPFAGSPFFEKAEMIVNAAQSASESGWKSYESQRNRYWLVENHLNNSYSDLRKFSYEYHRKGLDMMSEKVDAGRAHINENLKLLKNAYDQRPGLFIFQLFLDAKRDELINIFRQGTPGEKTNATNILKEIDPANSSRYSAITGRN
ncbi:MAG: DUF4835 family protein [Bacteroidales bacterium]|nr:DUF4835 family protein [Bacteroidales bacterium]